MSRISKRDISIIIGEMGRLQGAVKSEAESYMAVNSSGTKCVSIREKTANDLLTSLSDWRAALATLLEDGEAIEIKP